MIVALDATSLALLVNPDADVPNDPATGRPVDRIAERFAFLIDVVQGAKGTIVLPTPALAEALVKAEDAGPALMAILAKSVHFRIADFDQLAAIELATMTRDAIAAGDKKGGSGAEWQKVKIDRQIIAIARVARAATIYSDDVNLGKLAETSGLSVVPLHQMPLPAAETGSLFDHMADEEPPRARPPRAIQIDDNSAGE